MQPVHVTINVASSNPAPDEVYSIHYVIKFVSDFEAGQWFSPGTLVSVVFYRYSGFLHQ